MSEYYQVYISPVNLIKGVGLKGMSVPIESLNGNVHVYLLSSTRLEMNAKITTQTSTIHLDSNIHNPIKCNREIIVIFVTAPYVILRHVRV